MLNDSYRESLDLQNAILFVYKLKLPKDIEKIIIKYLNYCNICKDLCDVFNPN
jgi:hypothetical protein